MTDFHSGPLAFTTEDGVVVNVSNGVGDDKIALRLRMSDRDDPREAMMWLTPVELQNFVRALVIANSQPVVGEWGWWEGRAVHIPSYRKGHADAVEEFAP